MATKRNTTVATRLPGELFARLNDCIAAEVAARPRADKVDGVRAWLAGLVDATSFFALSQ